MTPGTPQKTPLWRDERFLRIAIQIVAIIIVFIIFEILAGNVNRNMQQRGIQYGYGFLNNAASFGISESVIPYKSSDPYRQALLAGLVNSLRVIITGIILTTLVGVIAGIASFSENWLLRKISQVYVEIVRNTPLLLQLFFWYFAVFFGLPNVENKIQILGSIFLSKRGVSIPWPAQTVSVGLWFVVLIVGAIASLFLWRWRTYIMVNQAASGQPQLLALWGIGIAAILIILFGFNWQFPHSPKPGIIEGGLNLSLEFSGLLTGLVFYTGAFIAEIVRAGIQSVPKGQWEAARSLGFKSGLVMRLVIFPQALRVIIPPLNSQYMNLAKNSSLAIAIGYPDFYSNASTTLNQTGRAIEVFSLIIVFYLILDLIISISMNLLNRTVQMKER